MSLDNSRGDNNNKNNEQHYADRLLARADQYLAEVDQAYIVTRRSHPLRSIPVFRPEEISLGPVLGTGGFGIVQEIRCITLDKEEEETQEQTNEENSSKEETSSDNPQSDTAAHSSSSSSSPQTTTGTVQVQTTTAATTAAANAEASHESARTATTTTTTEKEPVVNEDNTHVHYNIKDARKFMAQHCQRRRAGRYALKRLRHAALTTAERARGRVDLALEAQYLRVVWHPNIIKIRAVADVSSPVDPHYFIVLDRLQETLDKRLSQWREQDKEWSGRSFCCCIRNMGAQPLALRELLLTRLTVAYDLAAAFMYLHENRLVYRDIKPENIGFDVRGDVKVFDFGLCKTLSSKLKAKGYGYRLTGRAGSLPYMAPEVVRMESYDTKCDVFSFAILLWEIMSLRDAFEEMSPEQFVSKVVVDQERPEVSKSWPALTRLMIPEAWDNDPAKRPDMKRVAILIRGDLNDMTTDDHVLHRTDHMRQRSDHSLQHEGLMNNNSHDSSAVT